MKIKTFLASAAILAALAGTAFATDSNDVNAKQFAKILSPIYGSVKKVPSKSNITNFSDSDNPFLHNNTTAWNKFITAKGL
jgi:hypothetical protein